MKDIIFDLGGVLIDWNPRYLYKKIFASEEEMEWFLTNVCTPQWNTQQDAGRPFAKGLEVAKEKYPKYAAQIGDYFNRWEEMLGGPIKPAVAVLKELKEKGYRLYALSNWSAETFPIAREKYDFLKLFDGVVISGEERLVKPDPAIYARLLKRFQLRAPNCVFIDDNAANIAEAAHLGFETVLFAGGEALRAELVRRGLLQAVSF